MRDVSRWPFCHPRPAARVVLVFQCYLDDSGTSRDEPVLSMSGFVGRLDAWAQIEPSVDAAMNTYGVPVFHAKDFQDTKGHFKGWKLVKKRSFANEIFGHARGSLHHGISFAMRKNAFKRRKQETGRIPSMSAYCACFSALLVKLINGFEFSDEIVRDGMSIFVESGNRNNDELNQFFRECRSHPLFKGALKDISFIPKDECRAIQLADFFAFYSRKFATNVDRFDGKLAMPHGPYLEAMERNVPLYAHVITDPFGDTSEHPFVIGSPKKVD